MSKENTEYFIGSPIPLGELLIRPTPTKYPWLKLLKRIPVGHAQEVRVSYRACTSAISKLVKLGKIKKGEYVARTRRKAGRKRAVYILHYSKPKTEM